MKKKRFFDSRADRIPVALSPCPLCDSRHEIDGDRPRELGCSETRRSPLETATEENAFSPFFSIEKSAARCRRRIEESPAEAARNSALSSLLRFETAGGACLCPSRGHWRVLHAAEGRMRIRGQLEERGLLLVTPLFQPCRLSPSCSSLAIPALAPVPYSPRPRARQPPPHQLPQLPPLPEIRTQHPSFPLFRGNCCEREKEGRNRSRGRRRNSP